MVNALKYSNVRKRRCFRYSASITSLESSIPLFSVLCSIRKFHYPILRSVTNHQHSMRQGRTVTIRQLDYPSCIILNVVGSHVNHCSHWLLEHCVLQRLKVVWRQRSEAWNLELSGLLRALACLLIHVRVVLICGNSVCLNKRKCVLIGTASASLVPLRLRAIHQLLRTEFHEFYSSQEIGGLNSTCRRKCIGWTARALISDLSYCILASPVYGTLHSLSRNYTGIALKIYSILNLLSIQFIEFSLGQMHKWSNSEVGQPIASCIQNFRIIKVV